MQTRIVVVPWCTVVAGQIDVSTGGEGAASAQVVVVVVGLDAQDAFGPGQVGDGWRVDI
jgi:hypothetical protein